MVNGPSMTSTENRKVIYESPDGGKTVYARLSGSTDRVPYSTTEESVRVERFLKWKKILIEAENNKSLQGLLDQAESFYELVRNRK